MIEITKNLIEKHLEGRASLIEKAAINNWLKEEDKNQELYFQWLEDWERQHMHFSPDADVAYNRYFRNAEEKQEINGDVVAQYDIQEPSNVLKPTHKYRFLWYAAAVMAVIVSLSAVFRDDILYKSYETDFGEIQSIQLADNSRVTLNANTVLRVPRFGFLKNKREVYLSGEAVFNVQHTVSNTPFMVYGEGGETVRVLGTEFDMYSRHKDSRVVLHHGSICFSTKGKDQKAMMLKPGNMVKMSENKTPELTKNENFHNVSAWREHEFVFNGTSLAEIANLIKEHFGKKLIFETPDLAKRQISGSYYWGKDEEFLNTLSQMMHFTTIYKNDSIIIR